jgi:cation diffusion facilitator family transporter
VSAPDGSHGGRRAIVAALAANFGIAATKFVAFVFTGSSSMLAESVHSLADTGNEGLLLLGGHRGGRARDAAHQFGYGAERYFYAFLVSLVLFSAGGVFAMWQGVDKIRHPHTVEDPWLAITVLLVAVVLESLSFRTARRESLPLKGDQSWIAFIRHAKTPELPVVLLEDTAALLGLGFALAGVSLAVVTSNGRWDGAGTIAIGVVLVTVAATLVVETKSLLIGESAGRSVQQAISAALSQQPEFERLIHLRTLHLGPDELLVAAKVAVAADVTGERLARAIDVAEQRVRTAVPIAKVIYVEPDLDRLPAERAAD